MTSARGGLDALLNTQFSARRENDGNVEAVSPLGAQPAEALANLRKGELAAKPICEVCSKRVRSVTGPPSLVMFGDTSCVHKGTPVLAGCRAIMQLEYTTSLYLSPVSRFTDLPEKAIQALWYPAVGKERLISNYSSKERQAFLEFESRRSPYTKQTRGLRSLARKARRRLYQLVAL